MRLSALPRPNMGAHRLLRVRQPSLRSASSTALALLIAILLATTVTVSVARTLNDRAVQALSGEWLPARTEATELREAYRQLHLAQSGLLLTGALRFAAESRAGFRRVARLTADLRGPVANDRFVAQSLAAVPPATRSWRTSVLSAITARTTDIGRARGMPEAFRGIERLFSRIWHEVSALSRRIAATADDILAGIATRQHIADLVSWLAMALAVVVGLGALGARRRVLVSPLDKLAAQLDRVAEGAHQRPIAMPAAPVELSRIADVSEKMRESLVRGARELAATQRTVALRQERERLAADLHDHTVQEIFALALLLRSGSVRHPELTDVFQPLIDRTDALTRDLRAVIFDVQQPGGGAMDAQIRSLAAESERVLGFTPLLAMDSDHLESQVSPRTAAEVLAALRESLSNVARHAQASRVEISVGIDEGTLVLRVIDDGVGLPREPTDVGNGLMNLRRRAERLGGDANVFTSPGGGTTVIWRVPTRVVEVRPRAAD